jgi:superfamily II DNA helicase RecQ
MPESDEMMEQKIGRGGRDGVSECLAIIFAEAWALNGDPEQVRTGCAKEKRTPTAVFQTLNTQMCRRKYNAQRNDNQPPEGECLPMCILD